MRPRSPYAKPPPVEFRSCNPRQLKPLSHRPEYHSPPPLPSPPRSPLFSFPGHENWKLSTHIIPAAYPRTLPHVPKSQLLPQPNERQARANWVRDVAEEMIKMHDEMQEKAAQADNAGSEGSTQPLWCVVNRYVRTDATGGGVTLFLAHANGFPKEIWEPTLSYLLSPTASPEAHRLVDEIWSWEAVQHGDADLLNGDRLGYIFDWSDNARDIIQFLLYFLPSPSQSQSYYSKALPTHLPLQPSNTALARMARGFGEEGRQLVAVGHSFGGCSLALAIASQPALFKSLVLVDPVIIRPHVYSPYSFVVGALSRKSRWKSWEEAKADFKAKPFFANWDPSALDVYLKCGLTEDKTAPSQKSSAEVARSPVPVKLKTSPFSEAVVFTESRTAYETWERLADISDDVELWWIMPGTRDLWGEDAMVERVWRKPSNSTHVIIENSGHLITQENPKALAEELGSFLVEKYGKGENLRAHL